MSAFKFKQGDVVILDKTFPNYMSHFCGKGERAVVIGRSKGYEGNQNSYGLYFKKHGEVWWYNESLMTLDTASTFKTLNRYIKEVLK